MPYLPKKICIEPGCGRPAVNGDCRCETHRIIKAQNDRRAPGRYERAAMYATQRWQDIRRAVLLDHPWCAACLKNGVHTPAQVVDHIKPHKGDATLFFDVDNLQPLCKSCHDAKTAKEDGGFGRPIEKRGAPGG